MLVVLWVQAALLLLILFVLVALIAQVKETAEKANRLMEDLRSTLETKVTPALEDARRTLASTEEAAVIVGQTLRAAQPAVGAISRVANAVSQPKAALWLDAARLAFGLIGVVRKRREASESSEGDD